MILDTISWAAVAPGAAGLAATPVTGDSAVVRSAEEVMSGRLLGLWSKTQAVGNSRLTSPFLHDNVQAINLRNIINSPFNGIPRAGSQPLKANDLLSVFIIGSAVALDVELVTAQIAYPSVGGGSSKYIGAAEFDDRVEAFVTVGDTITPTVQAIYSGARALNAVVSSLKANRNYAVVGAFIGTACGCLTIRGQDTGNIRCAIPGNPTVLSSTGNHFYDLAAWTGMEVIPVINATNAGGTFIEVLQDENLTAVPFSLILALLRE
jgi:hypothetical protein